MQAMHFTNRSKCTYAEPEGLEQVRPLFEQVEQIKISAVRAEVQEHECVFLHRACLYASSRNLDPPHGTEARLQQLNALVADVQRVAVKVTQSQFYKVWQRGTYHASPELISSCTRLFMQAFFFFLHQPASTRFVIPLSIDDA